MQKKLNIQTIDTVDQQKNQDVLSYNGYNIAQLFLYYRRLLNPYIKYHVPLKLVSAKKFYLKNKDIFDKFAENANNTKFNVEPYIKFCVIENGLTESSLDICIETPVMLTKYENHLKLIARRKKIYMWFMKSANNIAQYCIDMGFFSSKDFIKYIIENNKVGILVASGKISLYYLAAFPTFGKIISKLDYFSRNELSFLEKHFEIYHSDINDAFIYVKNKMTNAIDITDSILMKLKEKQNKKNLQV